MTAAPTSWVNGDNKQSFEQAYEALVESERFQTEMNPFEPPEVREPPGWLKQFFEWLGTTGSFWEILAWTVAAIAVAALLFFLSRALFRRFSDKTKSEADDIGEEGWRPESAKAQTLLGEADALARAGNYAEAVHLLLYRSVQDIEQKLPGFLRPALTSRDIASSETLPDRARVAFAKIAQIVERGIFAARPVDEQGWTEARSAYERFAFGESWT